MLVLASASPRRRRLLARLGIPFEVVEPAVVPIHPVLGLLDDPVGDLLGRRVSGDVLVERRVSLELSEMAGEAAEDPVGTDAIPGGVAWHEPSSVQIGEGGEDDSSRAPGEQRLIRFLEPPHGGDVRAFAVLVEKYQNKLFNTTYRLCRNYQDACELTQEAFLRAFFPTAL